MAQQSVKIKNGITRSPTLDTVYMVEETIKKYSGEYNQTQIWKKLPKKVMWQTFRIILDYLTEINKIAVDNKSILVYIWNPKLGKKYKNRDDLKWE